MRLRQDAWAAVAVSLAVAAGCSGSSATGGAGADGGSRADATASSSGGDGGLTASSGSSGGGGLDGQAGGDGGAQTGDSSTLADSGSPLAACDGGNGGWRCRVDTSCAPGSPTTLKGRVFDPAGATPLYNVVVFVPNDPAAMQAITPGTRSCNTCDVSVGDYVALAQTDATGSFTLTGVPSGTNVPVTVQIGKWRRTVEISTISSCTVNTVTDGLLRLPSRRSEGDLPQLALYTGGQDDLGCLLFKFGIDASEFSAPHAGGRLDVYQGVSGGTGVGTTPGPGLSSGTAGDCTTASCPLWATKASLEAYDTVLLACEGSATTTNKPASAITAMHDWLDEGGKVFATHFHYVWFQGGPADFQNVAAWKGTSIAIGTGTYDIDTTFAKGMVLSQWLTEVSGADAGNGALALSTVGDSVGAVNTTAPQNTTRWVYDPSTSDVKFLTFGTPIGGVSPVDGGSGVYCGKAAFTDLHAGGAPSGNIPAACSRGALTPEQQAVEFLFFDLFPTCISGGALPPPQQ